MAEEEINITVNGSDQENHEEEEKLFFIWGEWSQNITTPLKMDFTQPSMIKKIALGSSFAIILDQDGAIWSWGYNEFGCIGQGISKKVSKIPEKVHMPDGSEDLFDDVVIGLNHVLALTSEGNLFAWGDNSNKQVGIGAKEGSKIWAPARITLQGNQEVDNIYASRNSSYVITTEGKVFSWGENSQGQLGLSSLVDIEVPKMIENLPNIGELVINGNQVIALQYVDRVNDDSLEDEVPMAAENFISPKKEDGPLSRGTSVVRDTENIPVLDRKTTEVKSVASARSARSAHSTRSARSTASSRMGGRSQPIDKLSKVLKDIIPIITEINSQFKAIDVDIENHVNDPKGSVKSKPLHTVFKNIQNIRESMKNDYQNALSLDMFMDDKESVEIKNFLTVIRDSLLDSLVLRSLQAITIRMKEMKNALETYSFVNLENFNESEGKTILPEGTKKYASLYHCKKISQNIKRFSSEFRSLTIGMTSASCSAASFAINSVLEMTQLWSGLNNLNAEVSKLLKSDLKFKVFNNIMDGVWKAYENISKSNLDRIYIDNPFDDKKFKNYEMYIQHIIKQSRTLRNRGAQEMQKIKEENDIYFSKHMKAVYKIVIENIELREMLSECTKNLILKNLNLAGILVEYSD